MYQFSSISPRITKLRQKRDRLDKELFIHSERTRIYTEYYKEHEAQPAILKRAGALYSWCSEKEIVVDDDDIFVGNLGPHSVRCANCYIEWSTQWLNKAVNDNDESFIAAWQVPGGIYMSNDDREYFRKAVEYWQDKTVSARTESAIPDGLFNIRGNGAADIGVRHEHVAGKTVGHHIPNFDKVIHKGFGGLKSEAVRAMQAMEGRVFGNNAKRYTFYRAASLVCDAAALLAHRYAAKCRELSKFSFNRRNEFLSMANSLDHIADKPARNQWEALQLILLYQILLITDGQQHGLTFGRLDMYLNDFMDKQPKEVEQEYIDAFILKAGDFLNINAVPSNEKLAFMNRENTGGIALLGQFMTPTAGQHLTIGGVNKSGIDLTNSASYMFIESYARLNITDPSVSLRIHDSTPDMLWNAALECSRRCGGIPTFENDNVIIPGLIKRGLSPEDARNYSIVGCVEPAGTGCEWSACGNTGQESFFCLIGAVVLAVNGGDNPATGFSNGLKCKKLYEYESFDEFKSAFEAQVHYYLDWHITFTNFFEMVFAEHFPCIVSSISIDGCMERGLDATWGGANYNSTGLTCLGTANVADSLMAIKKYCFDTHRCSLKDMYNALLSNWEGYEELRYNIISHCPHYGNNDPEVDELASWALSVFADHMNAATGPRGYYRGGTFTMTTHLAYGSITGATADGRKSGEPLAEAISPRQGFDKNGPTSYLSSAAKLPHIDLCNGDQLNIRFSQSSVNSFADLIKLKSAIRSYFSLGGMQVQFNIVSTETLKDAQKHPEEHSSLIVRIAGYSAYFTQLTRDMQDDFISRTEQSL